MQGFGELLKSSLDETGRFQVFLATSEAEAMRYAKSMPIDLGILDADMEDGRVSQVVEEFQGLQPSARWILIPPENDPSHPSVAKLKPDGYLTKPFYLPDLISMLDLMMQSEMDHSDLPPAPSVDFTQLVHDASARAGLVLRGSNIFACSHEISESTAHELAQHVSGPTTFQVNPYSHGKTGMARLVLIGELAGEFLLYATPLVKDGILILVYDVHTPLSQIRRQSVQMMKALSSPSLAIPPRSGDFSLLPKRPLLEGVPPSRPEKSISPYKGKIESPSEPREPDVVESNPWREIASLPESPAIPTVNQSSTPVVICDLNYTGLLVPRMPHHRLIGDLADNLSKWISQISTAFGWRLGQLTLLPEYMQWIVSLPPEVSPAQLIRIMRQHTSQRIFANYSILARENPSGDFWASGYLIMSGMHVLPAQTIESFIQQIRQYQGVAGTSDQDIQS